MDARISNHGFNEVDVSKEKKKSLFSRRSSAHKRPLAAVSRQGFSSPKTDWYGQSTSGQV
jgi:hypothetical protein